MASKNITLKVDEKLYNDYKELCKKKGLIISRQFEIFAEEELKRSNIKV
jgi:antitoxin component of RelBE/YafQ-DinJ toxin-antitoxin module